MTQAKSKAAQTEAEPKAADVGQKTPPSDPNLIPPAESGGQQSDPPAPPFESTPEKGKVKQPDPPAKDKAKKPDPAPLAQKEVTHVRVISDGTLGPKLLEKGAITDDPDYVAILQVKGQKKVEAVK